MSLRMVTREELLARWEASEQQLAEAWRAWSLAVREGASDAQEAEIGRLNKEVDAAYMAYLACTDTG